MNPVVVALGIGLVVRLARLAADPLIHPDGPAYLGLAAALLRRNVVHVLGGYYSPLYPAAVAGVAASGIPLELAGRLTALLAGLATLPLLHALARRLLDERSAAAAVLTAAVHPALVKASAQVLPETLAGALLLGWLLALPSTPLLAGALAGAAYLARPEAIMLVPLGLWHLRARRPHVLAAYAAAAVLVMSPALVALRVESGRWQLSPREARVAANLGVPDATTLGDAIVREPGTVLRSAVAGLGEQLLHDAKALSPLLWLPFGAGLLAVSIRAAVAWPLAVVAWLTAVIALNPSPRYAVPLVPLLLLAVAGGLLTIGRRVGRRAPVAAAGLGIALVVQGLWVSHPFDVACSREVAGLVLERYGPGQALVAVDGRFAYRARGLALVPASTDPGEALALARRRGARLWLTRPAWIRPPWTAPPDVRAVARPCGGTFVLFEVGS